MWTRGQGVSTRLKHHLYKVRVARLLANKKKVQAGNTHKDARTHAHRHKISHELLVFETNPSFLFDKKKKKTISR